MILFTVSFLSLRRPKAFGICILLLAISFGAIHSRAAYRRNLKYTRFSNPANNQRSCIVGLSLKIKDKVKQKVDSQLPPVPAAVLNAMLLGERKDIPQALKEAMMHTATVHILVVSGFNVGIVAFVVLLLLKVFNLPARPRYIITIPLILLYCMMTGSSVPVVRATIMATVILTGLIIKREADIYNSLALAGLIILCIDPRQLFNIGFQLSFASVLAIACLYPISYGLFPIRLKKSKCADALVKVFCVSFSAWLGTSGLIAYYFGFFSPIAILANMAIAPLASLITTCGLSFVAVGFLLPAFSRIFSNTAQLLILILTGINCLLERAPYAYFKLPQIPVQYILFYYSLLILVAFCLHNVIIYRKRQG